MKKLLITLTLCAAFTGCSTETDMQNSNNIVSNSVSVTTTTTEPTTTTESKTTTTMTTETTTTTTEKTTATMAKIIPTEIIIPVVTTTSTTTTTTTTETPVATTAADSYYYYELPTVVTEFDEVVDVVFVEDANGNRYAFFGIEDWEVGDIAVLTMRDLTAYEENDEIVSVRYAGTISE